MEQQIRYISIFLVLTFFLQGFFVNKLAAATGRKNHTPLSAHIVDSFGISAIVSLTDLNSSTNSTQDPPAKSDSARLPISTPLLTNDTVPKPQVQDTLSTKNDSLAIPPDSLTAPTDTVSTKEVLEAAVYYTAKDSMVFTADNMGYLYGEADVKYGNLTIKGEYITMDLDSSIISSTFGVDTAGKEFGYPVFTEGEMEYEMKKVRYNFETRKAFINNVITQQGEGHIVAYEAKMNPDNSFYMRNAKYTTCDQHDHPHFYLNLSRAKVRPDKDVVTGPAWLVVADVPLFPVVLPFAFFPFTKTYSSGIIMPSYGDESTRGFYLHNGGYYFALSDYVDLALIGEIYTKGSWGAGLRSNYRKRYKYSGNMNVYYLTTVTGERELRDIVPEAYTVAQDLRINWTHSQDPKANMYRTISASVNFSTSRNNHRDLSSLYSRAASTNTKSSSVNITQRFPDSPWNLTANFSVNQVSRDSTISATLPNLSASMSRINPLKRKNAVGKERWYEKITMSYSGEFRNSITTKENQFMQANIIRDWTNGIRHNIPISATFSLFEFIQVSPSFNYNERWYTSSHRKAWNPVTKTHEVVDTLFGFSRVYDYNTSISAQTRIYGMYTPWKIFGDKVQAIRHVFSPSISLSYQPDFADPRFNFFETYTYRNEYGEDVEFTYSPYANMPFGTAPSGKSGSIGFDFKNNLEMKVRSDNDSTGVRKISLIDDLGIGFSYNMMADSMKWSNINSNVRLKLSKSYTLSLSATWDTYLYDLDHNGNPRRVDKLRIANGKGFGRLMNTGSTFSYSLNQDSFQKWFGGGDGKSTGTNENEPDPNLPDDGTIGENPYEEGPKRSTFEQSDNSMGEFDADGYLKNSVNWNLSFNYSFRYGYGDFDKERMEYKGKLTHNFGLSGSIQPTKNWNFTFNTDYNFEQKQFTNINCTLTRNLHCWSMSASFIPIGPYKSYNFTIRANSSLLQDLKYEQRSSPYDTGASWY